MKKILRNGVVSSIILIVVGIILMLWPGDVMSVVCYFIGCGLIVAGAVGIGVLLYRKKKGSESVGADSLTIAKDVVAILLGIVLLARMQTVVSILPFLMGVLILINGGVLAVQAILSRKEAQNWKGALAAGIVAVLLGLVLVLDPFGAAVSQIFLMGLSLAVDGVSNLTSTIFLKKA